MSSTAVLDSTFKLSTDAEKADGPTERKLIRMARHRFQAGHVFKRGKRRKLWVGRWRERILFGGTLKSTQRSAVLGPCSEMSKGDAERRLYDFLRPINNGTQSPMQTMTFGEFAVRWKQDILPHYRESTGVFYKATLDRWILPHFRDW